MKSAEDVAKGLCDHRRQRPQVRRQSRNSRRADPADAGRRPGSHHRRRDRPGLRQAGGLRPGRHSGRGAEGHHLPSCAGHRTRMRFRCWTASQAAEILRGVRGAKPVDRAALAAHDRARVRRWLPTFRKSRSWISIRCSPPSKGATAADVRVVLNFNPATGARSPEPGADRRADEPHHEAECGGGHRRLGRERQDRQLGDEESHQRRLSGRDLSDSSQRRQHPGQEGLQERQGRAGRHRCGRVRHSGEIRRAGPDRSGREEDPGRGADPVRVSPRPAMSRARRNWSRSAASTACA